jgi:glycosyltransferase involved in cell wall biosynthesis
MKILLCAEFFHPSVGGVQEVIKQIGLGLVRLGHDVTVATSYLEDRTESHLGSVRIVGFRASGNLARGLTGEINLYRAFVLDGQFDAVLIYAAQQWTLDGLLDILPEINARKVLVPCGFSGLYLPEYQDYFKRLSVDLLHFDALVFHARAYRDYAFATALGLQNCILIPNGASEEDFLHVPDAKSSCQPLGIQSEAFTLLTVGTLNGAKGHLEIAKAVSKLQTQRLIHVVLNGNSMPHSPSMNTERLLGILKNLSLRNAYQHARHLAWHVLRMLKLRRTYAQELQDLVASINADKFGENRRASIVDLPRTQLVECFFKADLFVFASKIEYSPLVLFEAAAAGLPFLTTPVGNASEISGWTGAGRVCPAVIDSKGYTVVDTSVLASELDRIIEDDDARRAMGLAGRESWQRKFNWHLIVANYEKVLSGCAIEADTFKEHKSA